MKDVTKNEAVMHQPEYELTGIRYSKLTMTVVLSLCQTVYEYKKTCRSRTSDGVWAELRIVRKNIKKKLRVTKVMLENLRECDDVVLSKYANEIVECVGDVSLYPSWYKSELLCRERAARLAEFEQEIKEAELRYNSECALYKAEVKCVSGELIGIYGQVREAEGDLTEVNAALFAFDKKRERTPRLLRWVIYSDKKRREMLLRRAELYRKVSETNTKKTALEVRLADASRKVADCECRKNRELCEIQRRRSEYDSAVSVRLAAIV